MDPEDAKRRDDSSEESGEGEVTDYPRIVGERSLRNTVSELLKESDYVRANYATATATMINSAILNVEKMTNALRGCDESLRENLKERQRCLT